MAEFLGPDFIHNTPPRIMGSETEFTIQAKILPHLSSVTSLEPYTLYKSHGDEIWTRSGGRLYYDMGSPNTPSRSIAEFATPECSSASEVVLHEKAGELMVLQMADEITDPTLRHSLYKRSSYVTILNKQRWPILQAMSMGHHENYYTPLEIYGSTDNDTDLSIALRSYLATRPLWAGAGIVTEDGYQLYQKQAGIDFHSDAFSLDSHGSKIAFTQKGSDCRLEIRSGDGNMSAWAIRTKFAMTSLVLRLIEHGEFPEDAVFHDSELAQYAAERVSRNPYADVNSRGDSITHQSLITNAACEFASSHDVSAEERKAAFEVSAILNTMRTTGSVLEAAEQLADRVDWAAKCIYIQNCLGIRAETLGDITTKNIDAVKCDLVWEAVGPRSQSSRHYKRVGEVIDDSEIAQALRTPPTTRASLRSGIIEGLYSSNLDDNPQLFIDWGRIKNDSPTPEIILPSPYIGFPLED